MEFTADKIWETAQSLRICMLTSWNGQRQSARPMTSVVKKDQHTIYFLDKADSAKEKEIDQYPAVGLTFSDRDANTYLAIAGKAVVSNDRKIIKEIWSDMDKIFFTSAEDPNIRLISFTPESADVWQGPHKLIAGLKMLTAAVTGFKPSMGTEKKVAM